MEMLRGAAGWLVAAMLSLLCSCSSFNTGCLQMEDCRRVEIDGRDTLLVQVWVDRCTAERVLADQEDAVIWIGGPDVPDADYLYGRLTRQLAPTTFEFDIRISDGYPPTEAALLARNDNIMRLVISRMFDWHELARRRGIDLSRFASDAAEGPSDAAPRRR